MVNIQHAVSIASLPPLHKDPFDRLVLAQAITEGITLVTSDARLARYRVRCMSFERDPTTLTDRSEDTVSARMCVHNLL